MRRSIPASVTLVAISATFCKATLGCEHLALMPHTIDVAEKKVDNQAPERVEAQLVQVLPGDGYDLSGNVVGCVGDASAAIRILRAEDNRTVPENIGFRLILVDGELPNEEMYFPKEPVRTYDGFLYVMWLVGRSGPIEAVDFTIAIAAVDLAGNEGPISEPMRISHPRIER